MLVLNLQFFKIKSLSLTNRSSFSLKYQSFLVGSRSPINTVVKSRGSKIKSIASGCNNSKLRIIGSGAPKKEKIS